MLVLAETSEAKIYINLPENIRDRFLWAEALYRYGFCGVRGGFYRQRATIRAN